MARLVRRRGLAAAAMALLLVMSISDVDRPYPGATPAMAEELGFRNKTVRMEAVSRALAKKLPPGRCGSLLLLQEDLILFCRENMRPLQRKYCEAKFREIEAHNTCAHRYELGRSMSLPEKCAALRGEYKDSCGTSMAADDKEDCDLSLAAIKKNCK